MTHPGGQGGRIGAVLRVRDRRYQGDIHALTGVWSSSRSTSSTGQSGASLGKVRVPPSDDEVDELFTRGASRSRQARKYLPAARDYFAASLWRRLGLRINETVMLDIRDWRPDLGGFGQAPCPARQGQQGSRPEGPAGAGDQLVPTS